MKIFQGKSKFVLAANSAYRTNLLALDFSPNDPIGSRQNWKNTRPFEYKYPAHNHYFHSLATTNYPTSPRQNSPAHGSHLNIQKISSLLFHQQARKSSAPEKIQIVLAANHQYTGNIQRVSGQQQQPAAATSSSNQQQQSAAATSSNNQQLQPAGATSSSNQQQQPAAAINSSNQQQQPAAAINSSNHQ